MTRSDLARQHLALIVHRVYALEAEREALQNAAQRLAAAAREIADLNADAQEALDKYNALTGESLTLAEFKARVRPPSAPVTPADAPGAGAQGQGQAPK